MTETASPTAGHADVAATYAEAAERAGPDPLVVLEGLDPFVPGSGALEAFRLSAGHSNETFLVTRDERSYVLRRPPRPPWPPRAHDVAREFKVLSALASRGIPIPRPRKLCRDPSVLGAPFYVMEFVDGVVIEDTFPDAFHDPADRRRTVLELVETLADVHAVAWEGTALADLSPPTGYLERQLSRFQKLWEHNRTRAVPEVDALGERLVANVPASSEATLIHGDFKLDNAIFDRRPPAALLAVIDWELAAIGDPLADVGWLSATWVAPGETADPLLGFSAAGSEAGCPTRAELLDAYATRSGRSLEQLAWYECFAMWRIVIITEGNYKRYLGGGSSDPFLERVGDGVPRVAAKALELASRSSR